MRRRCLVSSSTCQMPMTTSPPSETTTRSRTDSSTRPTTSSDERPSAAVPTACQYARRRSSSVMSAAISIARMTFSAAWRGDSNPVAGDHLARETAFHFVRNYALVGRVPGFDQRVVFGERAESVLSAGYVQEITGGGVCRHDHAVGGDYRDRLRHRLDN